MIAKAGSTNKWQTGHFDIDHLEFEDLSGWVSNNQQHPSVQLLNEAFDHLDGAKTKEEQIRYLEDLQTALEDLPACLFQKDLSTLIARLQQPVSTQLPDSKVVTIRITDDPVKILLCGSFMQDSCQRVDGFPKYNQGLDGYLLGGHIKLVVIEDESGKPLARCAFKAASKRGG